MVLRDDLAVFAHRKVSAFELLKSLVQQYGKLGEGCPTIKCSIILLLYIDSVSMLKIKFVVE